MDSQDAIDNEAVNNDTNLLDVTKLDEGMHRILADPSSKNMKPRSSQIRRVGCLLAISALDNIGAMPIERQNLRNFLYMIDVILPVFNTKSFEGSAYKRDNQPYQLDWLWDADRLLGMGLLSAKEDGEDIYMLSLSAYGRKTVVNLIKDRKSIFDLHENLKEIAMAFSRIDEKAQKSIGMIEANCSNPYVSNKEFFDYGAWGRQNLSEEIIDKFSEKLSLGPKATRRVSTYSYLRALEEIFVEQPFDVGTTA